MTRRRARNQPARIRGPLIITRPDGRHQLIAQAAADKAARRAVTSRDLRLERYTDRAAAAR